mgnify:CR=1 FL=1
MEKSYQSRLMSRHGLHHLVNAVFNGFIRYLLDWCVGGDFFPWWNKRIGVRLDSFRKRFGILGVVYVKQVMFRIQQMIIRPLEWAY